MKTLPVTFFLVPIFFFAFVQACTQPKKNTHQMPDGRDEKKAKRKPPSSYNDKLSVPPLSAVFFQPDSAQFTKIESVTDKQIFKGSMHEYEYQIRNARLFLKQHWPYLNVIDTKNIRFLLFQHRNKITDTVDLNRNDPAGMYVFDGIRQPLLIDMTNVETQVPDYFSSNNKGGAMPK